MAKFNIKLLTPVQKKIRRRILEQAYESKHSHIGSSLSSSDLIYSIYKNKKEKEKFILSNGHAAMGLYSVLEEFGKIKHKKITDQLHIHPDKNVSLDIHASTGSLGQGLPIALGVAFADRKKNVYCLISDGECSEGSVWESFLIACNYKLSNLKIIVDVNGWGGYDPVSSKNLLKRLKGFEFNLTAVDGHNINSISAALKKTSKGKPSLIFANTHVEQLPFLKGQDAHYYIMSEQDYKLGVQLLK